MVLPDMLVGCWTNLALRTTSTFPLTGGKIASSEIVLQSSLHHSAENLEGGWGGGGGGGGVCIPIYFWSESRIIQLEHDSP